MKAQELSQKQQQEAARLAKEKELAQYPYMYPTVNAQLQQETAQYPYLYPTANAQLEQQQWQTEWPYKEATYQYNLNKPYYKPNTGGGMTQTDTKNANFANYWDNIKGAIDEAWKSGGWAGAVDTLPQLEATVRGDSTQLLSAGINPDDLIDEIYKQIGGFQKENGRWVLPSASGAGLTF